MDKRPKESISYADTLVRLPGSARPERIPAPRPDIPRIPPQVLDARINEGKREISEQIKDKLTSLFRQASLEIGEAPLRSKLKGFFEMIEKAHTRGTSPKEGGVPILVPPPPDYENFMLYRLLRELVAGESAEGVKKSEGSAAYAKFDLPAPYSILDFLDRIVEEARGVSEERQERSEPKVEEKKMQEIALRDIFLCKNRHPFVSKAAKSNKCPVCQVAITMEAFPSYQQNKRESYLGLRPDGTPAWLSAKPKDPFNLRVSLGGAEPEMVTVIP